MSLTLARNMGQPTWSFFGRLGAQSLLDLLGNLVRRHEQSLVEMDNQSRVARSISIRSLTTDINGNSRASSSRVGRSC
jgi:hypothetical protein